LARPLQWPRLESMSLVLLPALALSIAHDLTHGRTSVTDYGWAIYPAAWALHFAVLYRSETRAAASPKQNAGITSAWLALAHAAGALFFWARRDANATPQVLYRGLGVGAFVVLNGIVARTVHHWLGVPWQLSALVASRPLQAALTLTWTVAALAAMVVATRGQLRVLWLTGAGLLAAVVVKLFAIDLAALSGLTRVVAFLGVGALLL